MRDLTDFYMTIAHEVSELSRCEKKKVGAVAVKDLSIIDFSYNGTCSGWHTNVCEDIDGKTTEEVLHAEENIVAKCAKNGRQLEHSTVYCTYEPCKRCARLLYQAGVSKVVFSEPNKKGGREFLEKLKIKVIKYDPQQ